MTARDQARPWLARVLHDADPCPCRCVNEAECRWPHLYTDLANAILDAPGVQVVQPAGVGRIRILLPLDAQDAARPAGPVQAAPAPAAIDKEDRP